MNEMPNHDFIPIEALTQRRQPALWRTPEEFEGRVQEIEQEDVSEGIEFSGASRRRFLSLMAGSAALAGLTGCTRQPEETIMPYVNPPENVIPGKPKYYATAAPVNGIAEGVIVESHLGRPTKIEGNPDHPANLGATSVHSQASLMDLYDPDRAKEIIHLGLPQEWDAFQLAWEQAIGHIRERQGAGFRILSETVISPTLGAQIQAVRKKFPAAQVATSSIRRDHIRRGQRPRWFSATRCIRTTSSKPPTLWSRSMQIFWRVAAGPRATPAILRRDGGKAIGWT